MVVHQLANRQYDVVIVGAGLAGSTLAHRLSKQGLTVLVVERGDFPQISPWAFGEPVGLHVRDFANRELPGGPTKFYGAAMYRMREMDFEATQHEGGESPAWPIDYNDLEPYYSEAEALYRVHGCADTDPTEPRRSAPLPYPALPHAPAVQDVIDRLRACGVCVSDMPRALDYGNGGHCVLCPTCDGYYCRLDAKMDAEIAALRPALASGRVDLLVRGRCFRILTDERGKRVTGALIERDNRVHAVNTDFVVLCAGVGNSARILLDSKTPQHPLGLGNANKCVGRYFGGHTTGMLFPILGWFSKVPPMHTKTFSINTYYHGSSHYPYPIGVIQSAGQIPFWQTEEIPFWKKVGAKFVGEHSLYCFYMTEAIPTRESGFLFDGDKVVGLQPPRDNLNAFRVLRKLAIELFRSAGYRVVAPHVRKLWHHVGTVRFGNDPECSVLDINCKVHDIDRLYVVDASVLPSAGAVNTGLTIAALALRVGDIIAAVTKGCAASLT